MQQLASERKHSKPPSRGCFTGSKLQAVFCMLALRECSDLKDGVPEAHLKYLFPPCLRDSRTQCCSQCFGQYMWGNFCTHRALLTFLGWSFHTAIISSTQQNRRRGFVEAKVVWLQNNCAADAAHLEKALRMCHYLPRPLPLFTYLMSFCDVHLLLKSS